MTSRSAKKVRVPIVYFTPNTSGPPIGIRRECSVELTHVAFVGIPTLACGHLGLPGERWIEKRPLQMQGIENVAERKTMELHARQSLEEKSKRDEPKVTVNNSFARIVSQGLISNRGHCGIFLAPRKNIKGPPRRQA